MELQEIKQKLSELEERIVIREREIKEDKAVIFYLQGYVAGIEFQKALASDDC